MSRLSPARSAAGKVLAEAARTGAFVRDLMATMPCAQALDPRDRGLALRLVLGVSATSGCLDEALDAYLAKPKKLSARARICLRISAFELIYLKTAPEVAVSQGVELVRSVARSAAGLANAVLHRVAEGADAYLEAVDAPQDVRPQVSRARRAGLPTWLADRIASSLGERASGLFACELDAAPLAVQINPRVQPDAATSLGEACPLPGCRVQVEGSSLVASGLLDASDAAASDLHAQLIATAAVRPGSCLEVGAGRGTKTFTMCAQASRTGISRDHVALDLSARKCALNMERIERAGFGGVTACSGDACELDEVLTDLDAAAGTKRIFDTVLVDAPCSGTGTMRRHPEIPWRLTESDVEADLPALQLALLGAASERVAAAGELLFATCSVLDTENRAVVDAFLGSERGRDFRLAPVSDAWIFHQPAFAGAAEFVRPFEGEDGTFQSAPQPGGYDGHFCARLIRRS